MKAKKIATTKKTKTTKAKPKAKRLATKDLRAATLASVRASLGKPPRGGIVNGFLTDRDQIKALGTTPAALAKKVASETSRVSGLGPLKPIVVEIPGTEGDGILCGFLPPPLRVR